MSILPEDDEDEFDEDDYDDEDEYLEEHYGEEVVESKQHETMEEDEDDEDDSLLDEDEEDEDLEDEEDETMEDEEDPLARTSPSSSVVIEESRDTDSNSAEAIAEVAKKKPVVRLVKVRFISKSRISKPVLKWSLVQPVACLCHNS